MINDIVKKSDTVTCCDNALNSYSAVDISRIIEMAWEDRTPFEVIEIQYGLAEKHVIVLMRKHLKPSSFRLWRKRVSGRKTKHLQVRGFKVGRFVCYRQGKVNNN
ncbi:MAG: TIGR03643 family protein [Methylococcaceae bacterium]|nr:TIGR03643 family protein [Methylococcaceae bacterium]